MYHWFSSRWVHFSVHSSDEDPDLQWDIQAQNTFHYLQRFVNNWPFYDLLAQYLRNRTQHAHAKEEELAELQRIINNEGIMDAEGDEGNGDNEDEGNGDNEENEFDQEVQPVEEEEGDEGEQEYEHDEEHEVQGEEDEDEAQIAVNALPEADEPNTNTLKPLKRSHGQGPQTAPSGKGKKTKVASKRARQGDKVDASNARPPRKKQRVSIPKDQGVDIDPNVVVPASCNYVSSGLHLSGGTFTNTCRAMRPKLRSMSTRLRTRLRLMSTCSSRMRLTRTFGRSAPTINAATPFHQIRPTLLPQ